MQHFRSEQAFSQRTKEEERGKKVKGWLADLNVTEAMEGVKVGESIWGAGATLSSLPPDSGEAELELGPVSDPKEAPRDRFRPEIHPLPHPRFSPRHVRDLRTHPDCSAAYCLVDFLSSRLCCHEPTSIV